MKLNVYNNNSRKGVIAGFLSGATWGLDTVLVGVVAAMAIFIKDERVIFLAPFICAFLHDTFSTIWMAIYMTIKGEIVQTLKALKTRSGRFIVLAALMGGPVGMTGYLLAIKYIGPAYTATISSIYPAVGALFAFIFLKERLSGKGWIGLILSIVGICLLGYGPSDITAANYLLGFIFALVCVLGWALESVICAYGMKDDEVSPEQALQIRQLTSAVTYGVLIIPIIKGYSVVWDVIMTKPSLVLAITALSGTASYVLWYYSIHKIGATKGMILNITYSAWAILFQVMFLGSQVTIKLVLCCALIMVGSILATYNDDSNVEVIAEGSYAD